jgi:hypothetical protein
VLLWGLGVFATVQLAVGLLCDYRWVQVRFPEAAFALAKTQRQAQTRSADRRQASVVCLGSSRLGCGFRPAEIRRGLEECGADFDVRVFNAAVPCGDLLTAEFILQELIAQGTLPNVLVVEISPETIARRNEWLIHDLKRLATWSNLPTYFSSAISSKILRGWYWQSRLLPVYSYRQPLRELAYLSHAGPPSFLREAPPEEAVRWFATEDSAAGARINTFAANKWANLTFFQDWLSHYSIGGQPTKALHGLLRCCNQHGIDVVLVAPPVATPMRALYDARLEAAFRQYMENVVKTHRCRFADYRNRCDDKCFTDPYHLHRAGGNKFSRELAREMLSPLLRNNSQRRPIVALSRNNPLQ